MKLLMILVCCSALLLSINVKAEVAVIVNKGNSVELSTGDIKRIFLKKTKAFPDGKKVDVVSLNTTHPVTTQFNNLVLGRTASKLKAYWSKLTFTGKAKPMTYMDTSEEIIAEVTSNPNMIAYIDATKVTDDVRVLATF